MNRAAQTVIQIHDAAFVEHWGREDAATHRVLSAMAWALNEETGSPRIHIDRHKEIMEENRLPLPDRQVFPVLKRLEEEEQSKALPQIIQFIREKIVPTVTDIRLVDKWQRFLVTEENREYALDLTEYGEGMQRIFFISLLFAPAGNGVILIDEFENAIHTELISNFAVFIHDLAGTFNVQVFLTSHSKECIDAFVKELPSAAAFSASALVERDNRIEIREFSGPEFRKLVDAGYVDLRRAR